MTKVEVARAIEIAASGVEIYSDVFEIAELIHDAIDRKVRVNLSIADVAKLFRYQALMAGGGWDHRELNETINWVKRPVLIVA